MKIKSGSLDPDPDLLLVNTGQAFYGCHEIKKNIERKFNSFSIPRKKK
jgi:hypothetical protein